MSLINVKLVKPPPTPEKIADNINFGIAFGLTTTATEGKTAVQFSLHSTFTIRNRWAEVGPLSIKVKPARKNDLIAEVRTNADFLLPHEEGGDKHARSGRIAVPTDQVRRNKRLIIPRGQRPKGLGSKVFVLQTKRGPVLAQRITRGKRKGLIILYGLEQSVHIKRQSTFREPIEKVINRRLSKNIETGIERAIRTIK